MVELLEAYEKSMLRRGTVSISEISSKNIPQERNDPALLMTRLCLCSSAAPALCCLQRVSGEDVDDLHQRAVDLGLRQLTAEFLHSPHGRLVTTNHTAALTRQPTQLD